MRVFCSIIFLVLLFSCAEQGNAGKEIVKINMQWLDSVKSKSDTSWIQPYRNNEFVTAEYYVDRKDSIVTQIMKDSANTIRQIVIAKYDKVRLVFAEYYANGQLKAQLPLDKEGRYDGEARYFYEDGTVKSYGFFYKGIHSGKWKNYNEKGKLVSTDIYDTSGRYINSIMN
jgi:antitoxin component YwqK of YwqJK toxin-antitoxin module